MASQTVLPDKTKNDRKTKNSNATFSVILKQCEIMGFFHAYFHQILITSKYFPMPSSMYFESHARGN